jgi:membrane protein YqaA with SNARE-associated domain
MRGLLASFLEFARAIGGPGLFLVAFLDSSLLSLPEINDLLLIWMVTRNQPLMIYYAAMATLGSVVGCLLLYYLGRRGGEAMLKKRFHERHIDRAMELSRRYGALAIIVPALLPPPAPFKIFVLLAGIARVPVWTFVVSVSVGRGIRYFGEGLLALWYGELAITWLQSNGRAVALAMGIGTLLGGLGYYVWKNRRRRISSERSGSV